MSKTDNRDGDTSGSAHGGESTPRPVTFDELPSYVGYLIRRAHSRIQAEFEVSLSSLGLTTTGFGILTLIRANPGITAMELAAASSLDKSTLSPLIVGLERLGLIHRETRASDRRFQSLYFTQQAEPEFRALRKQIRAFEKRVAGLLTSGEQVELARLLMKLQGLGDAPGDVVCPSANCRPSEAPPKRSERQSQRSPRTAR